MSMSDKRDIILNLGGVGFVHNKPDVPLDGWKPAKSLRVKNYRVMMTRSNKPHPDMFMVVIQRGMRLRRHNLVMFIPPDVAGALMTCIGCFIKAEDLSAATENRRKF